MNGIISISDSSSESWALLHSRVTTASNTLCMLLVARRDGILNIHRTNK